MEIQRFTDANEQEYLVLLESETLRMLPPPGSTTGIKELVTEYNHAVHKVVIPFWQLETGNMPHVVPHGLGSRWMVPATEENEKAYVRLRSKAARYEALVQRHLERTL